MTTPLRSTPHAHSQLAHSQLAASQTAPVAEFRCLYTPDVRKKQKKWHDGYLKFHSFNNRVMVYDHTRNFLGDTYYKDSNTLHEGDELTLDKGVMVEVADPIGVSQTDLTPLFEKKPRDAPPPPSAPPRRFQPPSQVARPQPAPSHTGRTNAQPRHKSLNTLLGTPKGPIGKSVPIKSPFEAREEKEKKNEFVVDRAAKRQKTTHSSTGSDTLLLSNPVQKSPAPKKSSLWAKTSDAKTARQPAKPTPQGAPVINLDELDAILHVSPDMAMPSIPLAAAKAPAKAAITPKAVQKPALQTPKIPRGKVPVPSVKVLETHRVQAPPSSPPVSASNRLTNVDFAMQHTPAKESQTRPPKQTSPPLQSPPRQLKARSLRLPAGVKRGTLMMCQPQPPRAKVTNAPSISRRALSPTYEHRRVEPHAPKFKRSAASSTADTTKRAKAKQSPLDDPLKIFDDDQEVFYGLMDQHFIMSPVSPSILPEPILVSDSPDRTEPGSKDKAAMRKAHTSSSPEIQESEPARTAPPTATAEAMKKPVQKLQPGRNPSPSVAPVVEAPHIQSRAASTALSVSDSRSRTVSTSPHKVVALSTGGFRKNAKRTARQPTSVSDKPTPPRNETVPFPLHPLRANKKGPVMTTTELAAMLQKPKKKPKVTADRIEDDGMTMDKNSDRKFRRVRSENDAPIPSTSDDWEKRNLPKPVDAAPPDLAELPEVPAVVARKKSGLAALVKKTDPRRKFVRTQSLNVDTSVLPAQDTDSPMVSPVVDKDIGPWSTEAADLFDWRPPQSAEVET